VTAVQRVSRITMICSDPDRLADFYEAAFGFERTGATSITEPAFAALMGISGATARVITLQLGGQEVELSGIDPPGRNYPRGISGRSPLFQHFAIVVADMAAAYARLLAHGGCTAISTDGPQPLPTSSGGVTAYKFRDPDGHPLELIAFAGDAIPAQWQKTSPTGCVGIDHSAISVADTQRSVKFYERLGLRHTDGSLNQGPEQDKLDGLAGAVVEVTALAPPRFLTPHVELLCYRDHLDRRSALPGTNDIASTRLVLAVRDEETLETLCAQNPDAVLSGPVRFEQGARRALWRDPDGHLLCLESAVTGVSDAQIPTLV
jgi:catechol 2,3-dioxygenase-like lactoylglutathione lyase family enzyme